MASIVLDIPDFTVSLRELPIWPLPSNTDRIPKFNILDFIKGLIPYTLKNFFNWELPEYFTTKEIHRFCFLLSSEFLNRVRNELWFYHNKRLKDIYNQQGIKNSNSRNKRHPNKLWTDDPDGSRTTSSSHNNRFLTHNKCRKINNIWYPIRWRVISFIKPFIRIREQYRLTYLL